MARNRLTLTHWSLCDVLIILNRLFKTHFKDRRREHFLRSCPQHYDDVIMSVIASQITSLTIVYSTVYSDEDQRGTGEFPAQMASNAENVSIWWRHHEVHKTSLMICPHWSRQWLGVFRKRSITWANVEQVQWYNAASLGAFIILTIRSQFLRTRKSVL